MQDYLPYILPAGQALIIAILGSKICADYLRDRRSRKYGKEDSQQIVTDANEGKKIDAETLALKMFSDRLVLVEGRVDAFSAQLTEARVEKAVVEAQNVALTEERERMRGRMHDLATNLQSKEGEIHNLRQEFHQTQLELVELRAKFEASQAKAKPRIHE